MNEAKLKKLLDIFQESDIEELELQHSFWRGTWIRISRCRRFAPERQSEGFSLDFPLHESAPRNTTAAAEEPLAENVPEEELHVISAPMVGTFYRSPSPETEPFVQVGDHVRPGRVVCIIEAMKIMNEITADVEGEVVEILPASASPVEFDQPLLKIRPS